MRTRYGDVLDPSALDPGTALLVSGPAMSGKRGLVIDILAADRDEDSATVAVTTRRSAAAFGHDYVDAGGCADELSVVDCVTRLGGFDRVADGPARRYVADPGDLTGVGIATTELLRGASAREATPWLGIHSLSTMTMYSAVDRVFRFLHVLVGRVRALDGVVVAAVETDEPGGVGVLAQPFDGRLDVRETDDGGREVRGRGVPVAPRAWTPLG